MLLEDYALRCLAPAAARARRRRRYDAIAAALRELGFQLTRKGIRRGTSEVDRLLTGSQAKALGLVEVLAAEPEARGEALRGLVLCDAELASQRPDDALTGVLDPAAGTARHALLAIAADERTAPMRPLLVSGRGLRCAPARRRRPAGGAARRRRGPLHAARVGGASRRPARLAAVRRARSGCRGRGSSSPRGC